ncbi:MAG: TetR/AcrR family transcriptional regulator [Geminicoccaceae bacterium]
MELFWRQGFEATSVSDLAKVMGINPPSLYAAFDDKQHLFVEAVRHYQSGPGGFAKAALAEEPTAERAIRRLLNEAVASYTDDSRPAGCMVVLAATHCGPAAKEMVDALAGLRRASEAAIRARVRAGVDAGELAPGTDVEALGSLIVTLFQGLSIRARDGASREQLQSVVDLAMAGWPRR